MTYFHYNVDGESKELRIVCDAEAKGAIQAFKALGYHTKATNKNIITYEFHIFLEKECERVARERNEIAKIIAENFSPCGNSFDDSDFEWAALQLQEAGYHKVEGSKE